MTRPTPSPDRTSDSRGLVTGDAVAEHYRRLLAPRYVWMMGGLEAALAQGAADVAALGGPPTPGARAIDLGAGFGMHAIPLARAGWPVTAVDSSRELLDVLRGAAHALPVTTVEGDLLAFRAHVPRATLILCLGDTLTHLPDPARVERLFADVAVALDPGGRFVATFRDLTAPPRGAARFVPVRSDADRILTCFLEEAGDRVLVHDMVHERTGDGWTLSVGRYPKLRLAPAWARDALAARGLAVTLDQGPRGMVRLTATRAA